jgi:hypothetical protein
VKKPVVDYRSFRFSRINEPQYRHIWLLGGWIVYFSLYLLTENLISYDSCHVIHSVVDDMIPFCEYFLVFYVGWFFLVAGSLLFFFLYDIDSFVHLQKFLIVTQMVAMLVYILYPSIQLLRPESFPRHNVFTWIMGIVYGFDTPTGVCPSLHVGYSLGILSVVLKDREVPRYWKGVLVAVVVTICCAVCFVKQHSAVDVAAAIPMCAVCEAIVWHDWWAKQFKRNKAKRKIV